MSPRCPLKSTRAPDQSLHGLHPSYVPLCSALPVQRMESTVVAQRHLWLNLSEVVSRDRDIYLDEPVSAEGLFGKSLDAIQAKFEWMKKLMEDLHSIIPNVMQNPNQTIRECTQTCDTTTSPEEGSFVCEFGLSASKAANARSCFMPLSLEQGFAARRN